MDDIIYILLGLAWIGLAIYRNAQKKKLQKSRMEKQEQESPPTETVEQKKQGSLLEEILGQSEASFFDDFEEEYTETEVVEQPKKEEPKSFEDEYDLQGIESVEEMDAESTEKIFEALLKEQEKIELQRLEDERKEPFEFDLKKAVIYSEILNSRYF